MNPLYSYGYKKDTDIIQCAPENDFRNTSEFVCKISRLPLNLTPNGPLTDTIDCNGPWMRSKFSPTSEMDQSDSRDGWREEIKSIFKVYEHQCSPSWRNGRKLEVRPVTPDPSFQEEWEKGRRGRRQSITSKTHGEKMPPNLARRQSVALRSKRCTSSSTTSTLGRGMDGDLSTERVASPVSSTSGRRRSGHQVDSTSGQGQRSGSTSPKGKTEPSMEETSLQLPNASDQGNKLSLKSSSRKQDGNTSKSKDSNSNVTRVSEASYTVLNAESVNKAETKGAKATGKCDTCETNRNSLEPDSRTKRNNSAKSRLDVPVVKEILVHDPHSVQENDLHFVDTNKLSVPTLYDDEEDEESDDY